MKLSHSSMSIGPEVCRGAQSWIMGGDGYTYHYLQPNNLRRRHLPPKRDLNSLLMNIWQRIRPWIIKLDGQMKTIL